MIVNVELDTSAGYLTPVKNLNKNTTCSKVLDIVVNSSLCFF